MPQHNISVLCIAEGGHGKWTALCLTFDIAVEGNSFTDVKESLDCAIKMYLEEVMSLPENDRSRLLKRSVPWYVIAGYALKFLLFMLFGKKCSEGRNDFHSFTESVPCIA